MEYLEQQGLEKVQLRFLDKIYTGTLQDTGRICGLAKMHKMAKKFGITLESREKVLLSYNKKSDIIELELI